MLIVGIALAMVGISGLPGSRQGLRYEADRLAQVLSLAREEAQVRGVPIRLDADEQRYRFLILRHQQWQPLLADADLRERPWSQATRVTLQRADGLRTLEFGRDFVDVPFELRLAREDGAVSIVANGLGLFEVR